MQFHPPMAAFEPDRLMEAARLNIMHMEYRNASREPPWDGEHFSLWTCCMPFQSMAAPLNVHIVEQDIDGVAVPVVQDTVASSRSAMTTTSGMAGQAMHPAQRAPPSVPAQATPRQVGESYPCCLFPAGVQAIRITTQLGYMPAWAVP